MIGWQTSCPELVNADRQDAPLSDFHLPHSPRKRCSRCVKTSRPMASNCVSTVAAGVRHLALSGPNATSAMKGSFEPDPPPLGKPLNENFVRGTRRRDGSLGSRNEDTGNRRTREEQGGLQQGRDRNGRRACPFKQPWPQPRPGRRRGPLPKARSVPATRGSSRPTRP